MNAGKHGTCVLLLLIASGWAADDSPAQEELYDVRWDLDEKGQVLLWPNPAAGGSTNVGMQLFPEGGFQERTFNVVYYWARYGPDFLTDLYENFPAGSRSHLLWEL